MQLEIQLNQVERPKFETYRKKDINPLSGVTKWRTIHRPNPAMATLQKVLRQEVRSLPIELPFATAVLPGSSVMAHVRPHIGHQFFVQYDIEDAYGSVQPRALRQLFSRYGKSGRWIGEVAVRYAMLPGGGLITGAGASQDLFNVYAGMLIDSRLRPLLEEWGDVTYTRYSDDLVFSSDKPIGRRRRAQILEIIRTAGFRLSDHKTRVTDLAQTSHVLINGVGLRITGEIFISRRYRRKLFELIRQAEKGEIHTQQLAGHMGAFYAVMAQEELTGSARRLHVRYQRLLLIWREDPERVLKRAARRKAYLSRWDGEKRRNKNRRYRRKHPEVVRRWSRTQSHRRQTRPSSWLTRASNEFKPRPRPVLRKDRRAEHRRNYKYH